ncbi:hypothetical protein [Nocardioides taihuensis]|jgi:hypothetical protein|uniref:DUF4386 family protein n=1 Tax=Nocardioides taihuensis TaxID=1835606 RepID=A0ABW0BDM7_9ACTN
MITPIDVHARHLLWLLPVHATLLGLSTLTHQPDPTTDFAGYADYVTTDLFLVSHLGASILGAGLGAVGAVAVLLHLALDGRRPSGLLGTSLFVVGNVLLTAVFAAAAFAQPAIGRAHQAGVEEIVAVDRDVYGAPLLATAATGLLLFTGGAVLLGRALSRRPGLRLAGRVYATAVPAFALAGFTVQAMQPVAGFVAAAAAVVVAVRLPRSGPELQLGSGEPARARTTS